MPTELGLKMMSALTAVRELHEDASKLLVDLDSWMDKQGFSRFGDDSAVRGYSADIKKHLYMANYLFRRWVTTSDKHCLRAVDIILFDDGDRFDEPMIIAGELRYAAIIPANDSRDDVWTAWSSGSRSIGQVQVIGEGGVDGRLSGGFVIAQTLSSITSAAKATGLFETIASRSISS